MYGIWAASAVCKFFHICRVLIPNAFGKRFYLTAVYERFDVFPSMNNVYEAS